MKFKTFSSAVLAFLLVVWGRAIGDPATQPATQPAPIGIIKASIYVEVKGVDEQTVSWSTIRSASIDYVKDNSTFQIINTSVAKALPDYPHILVTFGSVDNKDGTHTCKAGLFLIDNKKIIFQDTITGTCPADKVVKWANENELAVLKKFISEVNLENNGPAPATTGP
jgi:hypothetical protein